jgi:type IV pilus assembly protein PilY1
MGGGYDTCEDADAAPATDPNFCSGPKGAGVYVIDAGDGTVVKSFATLRSVASEVALVDVNGDGKVDFGYVADTGGNIYRINFSNPSTFVQLEVADWTIQKVAYTNSYSRKFLFAPALLPLQGKVYVAIGSGDREHPTAKSYPYTTPVVNRFYVYVDDPTSSTVTNLDLMLDRSNATTDTCDTPPVLPTSTDKGWFMDLTAGTGEQTVTSAIIQGGMIAFSTNRPIVDKAACSSSLGEARGYWVNLLNGSGAISTTDGKTCGGVRSSIFVGGGLPPSPVTGVVTINGAPQSIVIGAVQRDGSPSTPIGAQKNNPPINPKNSRV